MALPLPPVIVFCLPFVTVLSAGDLARSQVEVVGTDGRKASDSPPQRAGYFTVVGKLVNGDGKPAANLRVEVVEVNENGNVQMKVRDGHLVFAGEGKTNAKGAFHIQAKRAYFSGKLIRFGVVTDAAKLVKGEVGGPVTFNIPDDKKVVDVNVDGQKLYVDETDLTRADR
jgi:hypothetical protein